MRIENQFRNNKEARAIQLDNELRNKEIGDLSIKDYNQSLKTIADLLANVEAPMNERLLVMYILNGLNEKFDNIINVIKHHKPFPTFEEAKNMLELEESRLKKPRKTAGSHTDHSSSPYTLVATTPHLRTESSSPPQPRYNNNNGRGNNRQSNGHGRGRNNNSFQRQQQMNWSAPPPPYWTGHFGNWQSPQFAPWMSYPSSGFTPQFQTPRPQFQASPEANVVDANYQLTRDFAEAFNTMTLTEPSGNPWYMDSAATAHLASSPGMLQYVFNLNTRKSVTVGNGSSIPITKTGSSFLPTNTLPLSLNNVLIAPKIIKNLISVRKFTTDNWCSIEFDPL